jgi:hypothetical protein
VRAWPVLLFGSAAAFNLAVAAGLSLFPVQFAHALHLAPIAGTNRALAELAAALIAVFAYAYVCVAVDPVRFRPFIHLGAVGKLAAFAMLVWSWRAGHAPWTLPALGAGDLLYALLFLAFLFRRPGPRRRTRRSPG